MMIYRSQLSRVKLACYAVALLLPLIYVATAAAELRILPASVALTGPAFSQRLLVQRAEGDQLLGAPAQAVKLTSSNPQVVVIENGHAVARGNGQATVTAEAGNEQTSIGVQVTGYDRPHHWSFRNHVQAVLAKSGCNSGACHGALAGKGGFKLSLRGYDTLRDYMTITKQARGRRVEMADPGRSLILTKPTAAVPHKGGVRFDVDSAEYQILSNWLADGAPPPRAEDPQIERLEILPSAVTLAAGDDQQFIVRAFYDDGHSEDVTRWAKFNSTDQSVVKIDQDGFATTVGPGEGAVTAWFASRIVVARVALPFPNEVDAQRLAAAPRNNFIDALVLEKLKSLNLPPSPPASDEEFLRRAYLDTIGTLPTAEEARKFLADASPQKRTQLIDDLLARPEFVDYWAYRWSDVLLVNGQLLRPQAVQAYYRWIRAEVAAATPWDEFVRKIVTAKGGSFENGATNFYAVHQDPATMAENVSQAFLGLSIGCAKCHNHPLEKWTNDQYYAFANLFSRVRAKGWGGDFRNGDGKRTLYVVEKGELIQPLTGRPRQPAPLDGRPLPFDDPSDRREHLARWLTAPENPYFSRAITNRIWANFLGAGLVESVDDMRISNPASNEALLAAAADYLVEHDYDLKALMRVIMQSATYQRSSEPLPENRDEHRFYSRYYPKRLMAEVLLDAISQVTGVPTEFTEIRNRDSSTSEVKDYPRGTRAIELADSAVVSYFLQAFGRNERMITCECERSDEPSVVQVLHIANGSTVNEKLASTNGVIEQQSAQSVAPEQIIEQAYLAALARYPTPAERAALLKEMQAAGDAERLVVEDLYWGILSSREFLFNH